MFEFDENIERLRKDTELALARGGLSKRDEMILRNMPLLLKVAAKYAKGSGQEVSEVFQEGMIGLIRAVDKYDSSVGKFSTYAMFWIRQKIESFLNERSRLVRVPKHITMIIRSVARLEEELGRMPTVREVIDHLGCTEEMAEQAVAFCHPRYYTAYRSDDHSDSADTDCELEKTFFEDPAFQSLVYHEEIYETFNEEQVLGFLKGKVEQRSIDCIRLVGGLDSPEAEPRTLRDAARMAGISHELMRIYTRRREKIQALKPLLVENFA